MLIRIKSQLGGGTESQLEGGTKRQKCFGKCSPSPET